MLSRARLAVWLLLTVFMVALTACSSGRADGGGAAAQPVTGATEVTAKNLRFSPEAIQVPAGTTVTWHFEDAGVPHDVKGDGFQSPKLTEGTWKHRFDRPGEYRYVCTLHAGMEGRVVVVAQ